MLRKIITDLFSPGKLTIREEKTDTQLKVELIKLDEMLVALITEKAEMEKLLADFHHRHSIDLGNLILQILEIKKSKYDRMSLEYGNAEKELNEYREIMFAEKTKNRTTLTDVEKNEIKKKFRKAAFLCHPDKVEDNFIEEASKVFNSLKLAYELNDLQKVSEILGNIENGIISFSALKFNSEREEIKTTLEKRGQEIKALQEEIALIKNSETFRIIQSIKDWNSYFIDTKELLQVELNQLHISSRK